MKKALPLIIVALLIFLSSCEWKEYSGDYSDLYTVALNSVLWTKGWSGGACYVFDPQIEKIDEDSYGRVVFFYHEEYYKGGDITFAALVICQASDKDVVFYYEDVCHIVKKQPRIVQDVNEVFDAEEIDYLKSINDWNKELDYEKCVRKTIIKNKPKIPDKKELEKQIMNEFNLTDEQCFVFMDYLTSNSDGSKFLIYGEIWMRVKGVDNICFVGLVEKENDSITKLNTFVPSDVYDYKAEFAEFKRANNWY